MYCICSSKIKIVIIITTTIITILLLVPIIVLLIIIIIVIYLRPYCSQGIVEGTGVGWVEVIRQEITFLSLEIFQRASIEFILLVGKSISDQQFHLFSPSCCFQTSLPF